MVRDLSELPGVIGNMAKTSRELPKKVIIPLASGVRNEVASQGRRYHVKGRNGAPVRLDAKVDKRGTGGASASVAGTPPGFWRIIEEGSSPHLITARQNGRRATTRARLRQFEGGDAIRGKPLKIPGIGYRQYAVHPGHGSVGRPWRKSMDRSQKITLEVLRDYSAKQLIKAFGK
jgi:hypothetical protein